MLPRADIAVFYGGGGGNSLFFTKYTSAIDELFVKEFTCKSENMYETTHAQLLLRIKIKKSGEKVFLTAKNLKPLMPHIMNQLSWKK